MPATDLCEEYASLFELAESRTHLALYPAYFGFCLLNLARFEQAKRVLQRGVNVAEEVHDEVSLAHSYMSLGMTEFITNPYNDDNRAKAIAMVKSASMTGRRVGDDYLASFSIYGLNILGIMSGNLREARVHGEALLKLAEEDGNLMARQTGLAAMGWLSLFAEDLNDASARAEEASALALTAINRWPIQGLTLACKAENTGEEFDVVVSDGGIEFPAWNMTFALYHETTKGDRFYAYKAGEEGVYLSVLSGEAPAFRLSAISIDGNRVDDDWANCAPK